LIGLLAGAAAGWWLREWLARKKPYAMTLDAPTLEISAACASGGQVTITGTPMLPDGFQIIDLVSRVYNTSPPTTAPPDVPNPPNDGSTAHGQTTFPINRPDAAANGVRHTAVVWLKYSGYVRATAEFNPGDCLGSGSGGGGMIRMGGRLPAGAAQQPDAYPRRYRVSAADGASLAAPVVLDFSPDASTPADPLWKAPGGAEGYVEWTLCLLYRAGGFGAVLSAIRRVGGRDERLTWVTSDWRFHLANRFSPESSDGHAIVVQPA